MQRIFIMQIAMFWYCLVCLKDNMIWRLKKLIFIPEYESLHSQGWIKYFYYISRQTYLEFNKKKIQTPFLDISSAYNPLS